MIQIKWVMDSIQHERPVPDIQEPGDKHVSAPKSKKAYNMFLGIGVDEETDEKSLPTHPKPPKAAQAVNAGVLQEFILEALRFTSMNDRQDEVADAHRKTFEWIFDGAKSVTPGEIASGNNFLPWLEDEGGKEGDVYWINGKAGSGKSTLVRFIYSHERTQQKLQTWAGKKVLTTAGFFFWTSGSLEQRSQAGLLRSLLHQLLDQHRDLISVTFPEVWARYLGMSTKERIKMPISWTLQELMDGLRLFLQHAVEKTKIFLFIDGLDEFDGDHEEIIALFRSLAESGNHNIKICLSSRPWPVFEDAFKSVPHLKLQDLTLKDRQQYVVDKFTQDARMRRIMRKEPETGDSLMSDIIQRSDGVFLWVILAVRSLLGDVQTGDKITDISQRLELLPSDLEDFFRHTLLNIQENQAIMKASQVFQLIRAREVICDFTGDHSSSSLTLWELCLANSVDLSVDGPVHQPSNEEILSLCDKMKRNIQSCCAGLIEIHSKAANMRQSTRFRDDDPAKSIPSTTQSKVTYLHRTVRDWLFYSTSTWDDLNKYTLEIDYDPHINHLKSYVLQLQMPLEEPEHHRRLDEWWPGIVVAMTHARYVSHESARGSKVELLDKLDEALSWYWLKKETQPYDHWARNAFGSYEERNKAIISHPFLSLATKFGLGFYISAKLELVKEGKLDLGYKEGIPLLTYAISFLVNRRKTVFPLSDPDIVQLLLDSGQDPNLAYSDFAGKDETPWLSCLKLVREALRREWISVADDSITRWTRIVQQLLDHGADVNAIIVATRLDPEITALGVVDSVCEKLGVGEMERLREVMVQRGAKA